MSKASIRNHARLNRRGERARKHLHRSLRGRLFLTANKAFSIVGLHIKSFDIDAVVDENISHEDADYKPPSDSGKTMCGDLKICGRTMNALLISTAAKLHKRGWDFTYDEEFIAEAQGKTVRKFKTFVYGNTR